MILHPYHLITATSLQRPPLYNGHFPLLPRSLLWRGSTVLETQKANFDQFGSVNPKDRATFSCKRLVEDGEVKYDFPPAVN